MGNSRINNSYVTIQHTYVIIYLHIVPIILHIIMLINQPIFRGKSFLLKDMEN